MGSTTGNHDVGGLIGRASYGSVARSYCTGVVKGEESVGGLIGAVLGTSTVRSFWDVESSGIAYSAGGAGLTTAEMMAPEWIGLQGWAQDPNWVLDPHQDYARLAWQKTEGQMIPEPVIDWIVGEGRREAPFRIEESGQLVLVSKASLLWEKSLVLTADLDLGEMVWPQAVIPDLSGTFEGNGHTIRNLRVSGDSDVGLVGRLEERGAILGLGVLDVNATGSGLAAGGLVGRNYGSVSNCCSTGTIGGDSDVGGLVGASEGGTLSRCYSACTITGGDSVGGLVGANLDGDVRDCHSVGAVVGKDRVGGLVGRNVDWGYTTGGGRVLKCYSAGSVTADGLDVGGLVGTNRDGYVNDSFWDVETSGQDSSGGGVGLTTVEMWDIGTYLDAGWDFVGEVANGEEEIWWILEGEDYPRLWWELDD
jgi:hypothetical protein